MPVLSSRVRRTLPAPMFFGFGLLVTPARYLPPINSEEDEPRDRKLKDWMPRGELAAA